MKRNILIGVVTTMCLISLLMTNNNKEAPLISLEKAEAIALSQAQKDGYTDVKIWNRFSSETQLRYIYSEKENKDIKAWEVQIDAAHNPPIKNTPAASYFVNKKDGSIISVIKGLTQTGMDLEIEGAILNNDGSDAKVVYDAKIINNGKHDYTIEWVEPLLKLDIQKGIEDGIPKIELNKKIPVHTELNVSLVVSSESETTESTESNKDMILGLIVKVKEENRSIYIFDNQHFNNAEL